jgi:hypothetical protein
VKNKCLGINQRLENQETLMNSGHNVVQLHILAVDKEVQIKGAGIQQLGQMEFNP